MANRRYIYFQITRALFLICNAALPDSIRNSFKTITDLTRCAWWSVKLKNFGSDSFIYPNVVINGADNVVLGSRVTIGEFSYIWGNAGLVIGDDTLIAAGCQITTLSHDENASVYRESKKSASISIGRNVWLGFGVKVMPGVSIGANSIVGAGSVVTKNIPDNVIAVGAPARVIRKLEQHLS